MNNKELTHKIQQLRNDGEDEFADAIETLVGQNANFRSLLTHKGAEVAALRAQHYTEAEQRQFVSNLIDNMPHAQIAAELAAFKAEVAAALEKLRAEYEDCPLLGQEFAIDLYVLSSLGS